MWAAGASQMPNRSIAKLLDLRLGTPFAKSFRVEWKLTFAIKQFVGDLAYAEEYSKTIPSGPSK